jgi:hypothetical protein
MLRRVLTLIGSLIIIAGIAGCRQIIVAEVLQQPLGKKVYLKHNIWYEKANDISCLNPQKGKILTFGTEVEPLNATDSKLSFKTKKDGKIYVIDYYHSLIMLPMEGFIKNIFTLETREELTKGMKPDYVKMLLEGRIKRGMTKKQILLAYGTPAACRTPNTLNSTWIYWLDEDSVYRVIFRRGKVNVLVNIEDKPRRSTKKKKTKK